MVDSAPEKKSSGDIYGYPFPRATTLSSLGHAPFRSTKHPVELHPPLVPPRATISIGRL
ncbi:hypothetical protein CASFOL_010817 [Castilleja foliolosa]|uniref:Uncharacterized protein n=1 Tax=Castilleja foliolosa TaxID=1961234 RepID=A0ABD3DVL7_9LAMI